MSSWFFPITRLCNACTKNDIVTVKQLADATNVNTKGFLGWAPLHNAASAGNADIVQFLLSESLKAEVDIRDLESHTPLMLAAGASTGETEERVLTVKLLLSHKADPNAVDEGLYPSLTLAVLNNNKRVAELLIEAGAKVNHQNADRYTALHAAASSGNAALIQLLLSKGADKNIKDGRGKTPIDLAKENGHDFDSLSTTSVPQSPAAVYSPPALLRPAEGQKTDTAKIDSVKSEIEKELQDLEKGGQA